MLRVRPMASAGLRGSGKARDKPDGGLQPEKHPSPLLPALSPSYCPAGQQDSSSCPPGPPPWCYGWVQSGGMDGQSQISGQFSTSPASSPSFSLTPSRAVPIYPSPRSSFSTVLASNPLPTARFHSLLLGLLRGPIPGSMISRWLWHSLNRP